MTSCYKRRSHPGNPLNARARTTRPHVRRYKVTERSTEV